MKWKKTPKCIDPKVSKSYSGKLMLLSKCVVACSSKNIIKDLLKNKEQVDFYIT